MLAATTGAWHYRLIGFFAGFGVKPIFAATNTTHANYARLRQSIEQHLPAKP